MAYADQYMLAMSDEFQHRVTMALVNTARNVINEDPETEGHSARVGFARSLTTTPGDWVRSVALGVAAYPGIDAESTDEEIQAVVDGLFNLYAGAL